jgi:hypothetical protein
LTRFRWISAVGKFAAVPLIGMVLIAPALAADSGKQDYSQYCAGCHGADGKGKGADLYVLPIKTPDISLLSKQNGGVFPFQRVEDSIDGRRQFPSHQRLDMPFWGVNFQQQGKEYTPESEAKVKARIDAIVRYVEKLQQK